MAKKKQTTAVTVEPKIDALPNHRLRKISVSNFRAITDKVEIELDDIVVLVGPNNAGKSSILKAYELAMLDGSAASKLSKDDFPEGLPSETKLPEVELVTEILDQPPAEKWIKAEGEKKFVREKWTWNAPGEAPKRQGYNVLEDKWTTEVPWGAANIANARRPIPHMIDAFADPEEQSQEILKIIISILEDKMKAAVGGSATEKNEYQKLLERVAEVKKKVISDAKNEIESLEKGISNIVANIFPRYQVKFDTEPEHEIEKSIQLFKGGQTLRMGPSGGYMSSVDRHGSGARRTLLWSALKFLEESGLKQKSIKSNRPHLLLIDEPEICLHPSAIRETCKVLYDLPKDSNWQVMLTTHSPSFIDLSRDNTTIIKVEKNSTSTSGTALFRPKTLNLTPDEKQELKLLNVFDPHVAEFFFSKFNVIVEGDTEYTAFKYISQREPELFNGIHVIRARGKQTICLLAKILNQFESSYSILHDSDHPTTSTGKANPAWTINGNILSSVESQIKKGTVRLISSKINFENAIFGEDAKSEKPYQTLTKMKDNEEAYKQIKNLLLALIDRESATPPGFTDWNDITQLEAFIK